MQATESCVDVLGIDRHSSLNFKQRGGRKVIIPVDRYRIEDQVNVTAVNSPFINAVARAFYWEKLIATGVAASGSEIAQREELEPSTVNERLRLSLVSPKIIESILNGDQPAGLTMQSLTRNSFPADWHKQEKLFQCSQTTLASE